MSELGPDGKPVKTYKGVAVKLKGAAGSFQGPDGKPGLTISLNKYKGAERFHGMSKFHLNNGAQDQTFLQEAIAGEMGRLAGVPVSRCTHALVAWNGRPPVLYVFKEGFTKDFFPRFFKGPPGSLYDGGFVKDIEENMEKDEGDPKEREDIKELIAACREGDGPKRWARLEKILDVDRYVSFLAMESILCHWDGYNFNRNNYRVYFDGESKRAAFFLHGLDQPFGDANFPILRDSGAMVGQAVLSNPDWKALYRERVE
jgi:spore coat protein CotH